jgi:hypothetical protein
MRRSHAASVTALGVEEPARPRASLKPVLRRGGGCFACSLGFEPIVSKPADCCSPAEGGIQPGGGVAVEMDENQRPAAPPQALPFTIIAIRSESRGVAVASGAERSRPLRGCLRRGGATPHRGTSLIPVLQRASGRSACSLGFNPILSKRADCRSPSDGGVHAGGASLSRRTRRATAAR